MDRPLPASRARGGIFRFTIREVLLLTVIIALGVGWSVERIRSSRLAREVRILEREAERSKLAIKTLYQDIEGIEQALPRHGLHIVWSNDARPSVQKLPLAGP